MSVTSSARQLAESIVAEGGRAQYWHLDVSQPADWQRLVDDLRDDGGLHVVVNNAGITHRRGRIMESELEDWDRLSGDQPQGHAARHQADRPAAAGQRRRQHREHRLGRRAHRAFRSHLQRHEVGGARPDEGRRARAGRLGHPRERGAPGDRRHPRGRRLRGLRRRDAREHADGAHWTGRGDRGGGALPGQRRGELHHRRGPVGRRRLHRRRACTGAWHGTCGPGPAPRGSPARTRRRGGERCTS